MKNNRLFKLADYFERKLQLRSLAQDVANPYPTYVPPNLSQTTNPDTSSPEADKLAMILADYQSVAKKMLSEQLLNPKDFQPGDLDGGKSQLDYYLSIKQPKKFVEWLKTKLGECQVAAMNSGRTEYLSKINQSLSDLGASERGLF